MDIRERLKNKYCVNSITGCWIWVGAMQRRSLRWSYGIVNVDGVLKMAHRVSYEAARGPIKDGLVLDHLCWNTRCVNPAHLEQVTKKENSRRALFSKAFKTECKNGHPLSGENLYRDKQGHRQCVTCRKVQWINFRKRHGMEYVPKAKWHESDPRHIWLTFNGTKKRAAVWAKEVGLPRKIVANRIRAGWTVKRALTTKVREEKTHCPHGHKYAGDNLALAKTGVKVCRTCNRIKQQAYRRRPCLTSSR